MNIPQKYRPMFFVAMLVLLAGFLVIFSQYYPVGVDWKFSYNVAHVQDFPNHYKLTAYEGFGWALFFVPHSLLPLQLGNIVNFVLHVIVLLLVIRRFGGRYAAILMTFTSPMFFDLMRTNNIDWLSLIGFLLPTGWGITFLLTKPQSVGGAALVIWKRYGFHFKYFLPLIGLAILSFLVFGNWLADLNSEAVSHSPWNFAPFPFLIPFGIYLLYKGWQTDDEVIAAAATPFLVPYIAPYSLTGLLAILAAKYPRTAFYLYMGFWWYLIVSTRRGG